MMRQWRPQLSQRATPWPAKDRSRRCTFKAAFARHSAGPVLIAAMLMLLGPAASVAQETRADRQSLAVLTTAHAAHSLTIEEAARKYPVHLRAVVTDYNSAIDPRYHLLFVCDSTGCIYVPLSSTREIPFKAGDLLL
jgi:hypothetical protein